MSNSIRLTDKVNNVNEEDELRKRGYIVGVTLGEGSYAKVKSAYSEKHDKKVALKIINRKKAPKDFQNRFLPRELDILRRIKHPSIIQLVDIMHFNHKVYIAMEMAGHGDLLEYIKLRGAIPEDKARKMFQQLADAIEYLHKMRIIHRDLKCENILLDAKNNLKLSDFGFARMMQKDDVSKTFCGSAAYAAPEILQGIPYSGLGYDIWSIGVILYIMVCGSMPYDDSNIKRMIKHQTERKVPFSRSKRVSETCKHLIHRMLDADQETRASIGEVQTHAWLEGTRRHSVVPDDEQKSFLATTQSNLLSFTPAALLAQYVTNFWSRDSSSSSSAGRTPLATDTNRHAQSERRYNDAWTRSDRKRGHETMREQRHGAKTERSIYS